jgi:hypothetical protein
MFLLDANVFIEASRTYYSETIAPAFWDWLIQQFEAGQVASVPQVKKEILDGRSGHLTKWAKKLPSGFWVQPTQNTVASMTTLTGWTMDPARQYREAARNVFLAQADYFLIATAHGDGHTVVTREQPSPDSKKRILIPDACTAMGVRYQDPFSVYEALGLHLRA